MDSKKYRGLEFTSTALRRSVDNVDEELTVSFTEAYGATLKKYHSMLIRPMFTVCCFVNLYIYVCVLFISLI